VDAPRIEWTEDGALRQARWRSERGAPPPKRVIVADDTLSADAAFDLATQGTALLWRGDFQNARQLLVALARRVDRPPKKSRRRGAVAAREARTTPETFHAVRLARSQRARTLGMLLVPLGAAYEVPLRRAPDLRQACEEAWGPPDGAPSVASLRELQGLVGAHEWRRTGIEVPALGARIHPHYGVFAPVRGEYVDLVARAPLPDALKSNGLAFDVGTGTGVLAAVLSRRGIARVIATENSPRALACARENVGRLKLAGRVEVVGADLFPEGLAPLIVCNPPWVPARPSSPLERGIYDEGSAMLRGFLRGLGAHLAAEGEGWLVLSDLAEHLGLRSREELLAWIAEAGLKVIGREDIRPRHPKADDADDPLHAARAAEVTSLWRLAAG
jgi:methylase of polypeptide subunit release factors